MASNKSNTPDPKKTPNKTRTHRPTRMNAEEVKAVLPAFKDTGATLPQARFSACYVTNGFNARKAYKDAVSHNCKNTTADAKSYAWLRNPKVQACIQQFTAGWLEDCRGKLEGEIIRTLWAQAFYDPSKFINTDGSVAFKDWEDIPEELRRCVEGIETKHYGVGENASETTVLKMVSRGPALKDLAQYISLMQGQNSNLNINVTPETELLLKSLFSKSSRLPDRQSPPGPKPATTTFRRGG